MERPHSFLLAWRRWATRKKDAKHFESALCAQADQKTEQTGWFGSNFCGGAFARFANHPYKDKGREEIHQALQKIYDVYMPRSMEGCEYGEKEAEERADIAWEYGFTDICYKLYHRTRTFTAKEYTDLLGTYSDHMIIEEETRKAFFSEIETVINQFGGKITIYDTIDLQLARKP